ncbi:MAG: alpha-amylase family glycosyl hydrolase, partial [Anaerolineales bacterium]
TSRDKYQLDHILFAATGNIIFANFHAARKFAQRMNEGRGPARFPERAAQAVRAGEINALGLIDEILHLAIAHYRGEANPQVMAQALSWLEERLGKEKVDNTLHRFTSEFPPLAVYRGELDIPAHLEGSTEGVPNREIALEEMLLLWLANQNPAFQRFDELFDDASLEKYTAYSDVMDGLRVFFDAQLKVGPDGTPGSKPSAQNLIDFLHAPALAAPRSLTTQLEYIHKEWNISQGILYRLLNSLDLIREENKTAFTGPGPALVHEFTAAEGEHERFSLDTEWMPRLVIIAKNTFVWLDQLSQKYGQPITRLDQVPDEELDTLARWGFTGLWLIGLWERSPASRRIKQLTGNPEAIASAYSLYDYTIAGNLGGDAAYQNLRARAHARGVRLAADMVPNHTGIYSKWVLEHPDWYISLDQPPFPTYTFDSPDISENPDIGITLEDHYYERTDAAVVFKRTDRRTGRTDYIYHGNDGTSMPWNDTAQLNYLNPEVREAVIQAILGVARKFPIIRFDAAMTLAKKHFQRLWFPEPGSGGAIPSRAGLGLTRSEMDQAMPKEFWREVVDRIALEVPDTLLLAEAFWLMEGYFVRTLGMHRVYNSAFMNMLRDEKNAEYRQVIKNTLEFDPEILERYVNFMNNPDEETAVTQFGKGGKYFGVCTLMITMPGLSMFGHGQIGGLTEKYGMEYKRAFLDEHPDPGLVARHEREIFPLLHRRRLFAGVENFLLYDFFTPNGEVDENVFAYSNRASGQGAGGQEAGGQIRNTEYGIRNTSPGDRALVIYHNKWAETRGWIKTSAAFAVKTGDGEGKTLAQRTLGEGLALTNEEGRFVIFRDHITGLEYIRSNREIHEKGLYVELGAYQYQVFLDFREVQGSEPGEYAALADYLHGRGVPDLEEARKEL